MTTEATENGFRPPDALQPVLTGLRERFEDAIVEVGGKQYRVEEGGEVVVDRLDAAEGATVELRALMVADGSDVRFAGEGRKTKITARVVEHLRGPKITISRFKPKRGWRKKAGFRAGLTRLEIKKISLGAQAKKSTQEG